MADACSPFARGIAGGKKLLCADGIHPDLDGWRAIARATLDALGCPAPLVERTPLHPGSIAGWWIGPATERPFDEIVKEPGAALFPVFDPCAAGWTRYDPRAVRAAAPWTETDAVDRGAAMPAGFPLDGKRCAFAAATVRSPEDRTEVLRVSSFLSLAIWVNGELVWKVRDTVHGLHPDAGRLPVRLRKGENRIAALSNCYFYVALGPL